MTAVVIIFDSISLTEQLIFIFVTVDHCFGRAVISFNIFNVRIIRSVIFNGYYVSVFRYFGYAACRGFVRKKYGNKLKFVIAVVIFAGSFAPFGSYHIN